MTMTTRRRRPELSHCIQTLHSLPRDISSESPSNVAELYAAIVGFLCHLKVDQATLQRIQKEHNDKETCPKCPPPEDIPAISAVIHDQVLFKSLVSCLSTSSHELESHNTSSSSSTFETRSQPTTRKRTYSFANDSNNNNNNNTSSSSSNAAAHESAASKCLKVAHSPTVSKRVVFYTMKPQFNLKTTAATILATAFEHLDHWPVPLIKVYADDCFGQRSWVDEPACQLLVKNLALSHKTNPNTRNRSQEGEQEESDNDNNLEDDMAIEALAVAQFYRARENMDKTTLAIMAASSNITSKGASTSPTSPIRQRGRGSISSVSSQLSSSMQPPLPQVVSSSLSTRPIGGSILRSSSVGPQDTTIHLANTKKSNKVAGSSTRGDDSDSGDDEEVEIRAGANSSKSKSQPPKQTSSTKRPSPTKKPSDDGSSSSSGEEDDEEVLVTTKSFDEDKASRASPNLKDPSSSLLGVSSSTSNNGLFQRTYPVLQENLNLERVRQRYFGVNLDYAYLAISSSLSERLDVKSKQNSGLLQSLPSFTSIPSVRTLITSNLEKWLQSPALSGLARNLFAKTVKMMKKVDPPLPADLEAIDNILSMRLKANQLNAHIGNVTAIATKIPTAAVSHHIYFHLLREVLLTMETADKSVSDHLIMIGAVHGALPSNLSAEGIAAALLTMLIDHADRRSNTSTNQLVQKLRALIRAIAGQLGSAFDGYQLLHSLLAFDAKGGGTWTTREEEDKARLMFQCVTLLAAPPPSSDRNQQGRKLIVEEIDTGVLNKNLRKARKALLRWCCCDYAPLCTETKNDDNASKAGKSSEETVGAGIADYNSILDGLQNGKIPQWLKIMRSVLFMEDSGSSIFKDFLLPGGSMLETELEWQEEARRIDACFEHGGDLDDEMIWIVLKATTKKSGGTPPDMALRLLEHLFECCNKNRKSCLKLQDPDLVWELYKLVEYSPPKHLKDKFRSNVDALADESEPAKNGKQEQEQNNGLVQRSKETNVDLPRLAYPGMWWRVTSLVLVMCSSSPEHIGAFAWTQHPTVQALIKMVTSDRYRFPTVDCDDLARDEMKRTEQTMRDEEARVTELLFLPRKPKAKQVTKPAESGYGGSRVSKRQRDKREKLLQKQREKEAAEALAEENRRKKTLKAAQKSIMLWDPKKGPRKPPRESADLIFSVGELFSLPKTFQRSIHPDFVLMTIGQTSRGAIERAYDWLIPIISFFPDTISRLPASASCFLLLRAYGTEGEERAQLQKLSHPLLEHVRDSLKGRFGEADAVRAFDLLLTDVASRNPDRRRCARRVMHEAIGKEPLSDDPTFEKSKCSWMINILKVQHVESIIGDAIKYMSLAVTFERGKTLRSLVLALERHMAYAKEKSIPGSWDFPSMLIGLISSRPAVFTGAMSTFPDLRSLAIRVVHEQFDFYIKAYKNKERSDMESAVIIKLCQSPNTDEKAVEAMLPLAVLQSASVLLSVWREKDRHEPSSPHFDAGAVVDELVCMLMRPQDSESCGEAEDANNVHGLASARLAGSGKGAVTVESWVMLARSRSDFIARRAALTAPTGFLPRLLLCSGLPRASLLTMIDRLGRLGESASDKGKVFSQLLIPSAASEWDIGRLGHRREVSRKLLGRLLAYSRMYQLTSLDDGERISFTFLEWLSEACRSVEKPRKFKLKKSKGSMQSNLPSIRAASEILGELRDEVEEAPTRIEVQLDGDESDMTKFRISGVVPTKEFPEERDAVRSYIDYAFERNEPAALESWFDTRFNDDNSIAHRSKKRRVDQEREKPDGVEVSLMLLNCHIQRQRMPHGLASSILKWVPRLTRQNGCPELWMILFSNENSSSTLCSLLSRCMQCWCRSHISSCRDWLFSQADSEELKLNLVVRFLVHTSAQNSIHVESFGTSGGRENSDWGSSEEFATRATSFALDCLEQEPRTTLERSLRSRNNPPDCVVLLLLLARCGRSHVQFVSQAVVQRIEQSDDRTRMYLLAIILRLYAYFPHSMNLGIAVLRSLLKEAVEAYSQAWLIWRSPLDDQLHDMLDSIISPMSPARLVQALSEVSKKHPLMILRKLDSMESVLEADATVSVKSPGDEKRGIVHGQAVTGPLVAKLGGKNMKLTVRHWGFNFTENLWLAFLDVISSVPGEVLFGCGIKMGLPNFLAVYLRLMFVQTQLLTMDRLARLKGKLSEFFESFRASNSEGWETWLAMKTPGLNSLGGVRTVLMSCNFITHQQAINSLKRGLNQSPAPTVGSKNIVNDK